MNEVWSGKKSWPKPRDTNESPASRSSGSSNTSGSGVGGIVVAGAVILVLISVFNRSGSVSKVAAPPPPQIQPSTLAPSPPTQVVIPTPILAPAETKTSAVSAQSPALRVGSSLTFQEPVSANVSSSPTVGKPIVPDIALATPNARPTQAAEALTRLPLACQPEDIPVREMRRLNVDSLQGAVNVSFSGAALITLDVTGVSSSQLSSAVARIFADALGASSCRVALSGLSGTIQIPFVFRL